MDDHEDSGSFSIGSFEVVPTVDAADAVLRGAARLRSLPRVYEAPGRVHVPNLLDALRMLATAWKADGLEQPARELLVLVDEAEGNRPR